MDISLNILGRSFPIKRAHGEIIVFSAVNSKLLFKVVKRIKSVSDIEVFIIFAVRALDLAVVSRRVWPDQFVPYPTLFEARLKQCGGWIIALAESLREFTAIIRLHTFHLKRKSFKHMFEENR